MRRDDTNDDTDEQHRNDESKQKQSFQHDISFRFGFIIKHVKNDRVLYRFVCITRLPVFFAPFGQRDFVACIYTYITTPLFELVKKNG